MSCYDTKINKIPTIDCIACRYNQNNQSTDMIKYTVLAEGQRQISFKMQGNH